jgi:hypothetical protein
LFKYLDESVVDGEQNYRQLIDVEKIDFLQLQVGATIGLKANYDAQSVCSDLN